MAQEFAKTAKGKKCYKLQQSAVGDDLGNEEEMVKGGGGWGGA